MIEILLTLFVIGYGGFRLLQRMISGDSPRETSNGSAMRMGGTWSRKRAFPANYRYDRILKTIHLSSGQTVTSSELVDLLAPQLEGGAVRARQFVASPYVAAFVSDGDGGLSQHSQPSKQTTTSSHQVNTEQVTSTSSSLVENEDKDAGSSAVFWDESF
jgi:hypothetical protein